MLLELERQPLTMVAEEAGAEVMTKMTALVARAWTGEAVVLLLSVVKRTPLKVVAAAAGVAEVLKLVLLAAMQGAEAAARRAMSGRKSCVPRLLPAMALGVPRVCSVAAARIACSEVVAAREKVAAGVLLAATEMWMTVLEEPCGMACAMKGAASAASCQWAAAPLA